MADKNSEETQQTLTPEEIEKKPLIWWLGQMSPGQISRLIATIFAAMVAVFGGGIFAAKYIVIDEESVTVNSDTVLPPVAVADKLRLAMNAAYLRAENTNYFFTAPIELSNISDHTLSIQGVFVNVKATSGQNGNTYFKSVHPSEAFELKSNSVKRIDILDKPIGQWERIGGLVDDKLTPSSSWFEFFIQVIGTDIATGEQVWLEINVPKLVPLSCASPCMGVQSINITAGRTKKKKCDVIPVSGNFLAECLIAES